MVLRLFIHIVQLLPHHVHLGVNFDVGNCQNIVNLIRLRLAARMMSMSHVCVVSCPSHIYDAMISPLSSLLAHLLKKN